MSLPAESNVVFATQPNLNLLSQELREKLLNDPGFGEFFTDHMIVIDWTEGLGWHDARVQPRSSLMIDPAAAVLHYAQEIFEGMKAYAHPDGSIALFRPEMNARRFNQSAQRMAMPQLPEEMFVSAVKKLVQIDRDWIPTQEGASLYIRPFMIATEAFLGVRPAKRYQFVIIASPAGNYFKSATSAVSLWVSHHVRAAPGGTGAAKCGGNYAASLVPQQEAIMRGHDQVVFLDAMEGRWIEELGGMNLFFLFDDDTLLTPALTGTILPGITRDSLLTLARDDGLKVVEGRYAIEDWQADAASGKLAEAFACGTAAMVAPIARVESTAMSFRIGQGLAGERTMALRNQLISIQQGRQKDPYGWICRV